MVKFIYTRGFYVDIEIVGLISKVVQHIGDWLSV